MKTVCFYNFSVKRVQLKKNMDQNDFWQAMIIVISGNHVNFYDWGTPNLRP